MEQYNKFQEFFTRQLTIISNKQNFFLENFKKGIFGINDFEKLGFMDFSLAFDKSNIEFFENLGVIQPKEIKLVDIKELDEDEDIKDCITEPINNHFVWGKYGEFKVVICKKNSYINGSHLYAEAVKYENALKIKNGLKPSTPAKINKWFDNEKTVELFESAAEDEGLDINDLSFILGDKQKKGQEMLKGTYLHPILINSLAMWISTKYALKINKLVNSYHAKTERNKSIKLLKKKDDIISRLEKMISDQNIRSDISLKNNEKMISNQVNKLSKIVGYTESIAKDVRLKTTQENYHQIFVYKIFDHDNGALFYKCYRLHSKSVGIINSDKKKNRNLRFICIFSDDCVNSIQTWIKIKNENKNLIIDKTSKSGTRFTLKPLYTDFMLIDDFYKITGERVLEIANINN